MNSRFLLVLPRTCTSWSLSSTSCLRCTTGSENMVVRVAVRVDSKRLWLLVKSETELRQLVFSYRTAVGKQ